jgi:hypothetical protein
MPEVDDVLVSVVGMAGYPPCLRAFRTESACFLPTRKPDGGRAPGDGFGQAPGR